MKTCFRRTLLLALAAGISTTIVSAHGSKAVAAPEKKEAATNSTKAQGIAGSQAMSSANPEPVAVPSVDLLPLAQGRQSIVAAEAGELALARRRLGAAEANFRHAVELDDSNANALAGLAQTLEMEGKDRQAISVYRYLLYPKQGWGTSLEEDPILRMHFALLLVGDGQWAEATSIYENTIGHVSYGASFPSIRIQFYPDAPQPRLFQAAAHLMMGIVYSGRLEHTEAFAEYGKALQLAPDSALTNYYYGLGWNSLGREERKSLGSFQQAKAALEKAVRLAKGPIKAKAQKALQVAMSAHVTVKPKTL